MIKAFRLLLCVAFGWLVAELSTELWQTILMFVLYFGYGILNYIDARMGDR